MYHMQKKGLLAVPAILVLFMFLGSGGLMAEEFPSKPITVIIPFGAGGSHDLNARVFTSVIPTYLGQPMVVKLMPGASGQKATAAAIKAKPDGYTLLFTHNFIDQLQQHVENLPYDSLADLVTVWKLNDSQPLLFIRSDAPWESLPDLMEYGRKNPRKLVFTNSGKWGASFTPGAMLFAHAGVQVKFVPYKGGAPSRRAVLAGDGDFTFGRPSHILSDLRAGKLRILAVAGGSRLEEFPEVPSFKELGYPETGSVMDRIIMVRRDTPAERIEKLRAAFSSLYEDKTFKRLMKQLAENMAFMDGAEYEQLRATQSDQYAKLVKQLTEQ